MNCKLQECEHSDTLRRLNVRLYEIKQEFGYSGAPVNSVRTLKLQVKVIHFLKSAIAVHFAG